MAEYLLAFEVDEETEQVSLHGDPAGLEYFAKKLMDIAAEAKSGDFPHDHLFTEEWGGHELSSQQQSENMKIINHVKVFGWPTSEGGKPYVKT